VVLAEAVKRFRPALVAMMLAAAPRPAPAQGWPFMFTVTTEPLASELRWTARYEAGYGQRSPAPFGFDGVDSVLSIQGPLGRGFTLRGQAGLGIEGDRSARTTQEIELLKDLRPATRGLGVAMGVGLRREWQGATVILGRVSAGHSFARSSLFGNLRFERAIEPGRDRVDVLTTLGWRWTFGPLHGLGRNAASTLGGASGSARAEPGFGGRLPAGSLGATAGREAAGRRPL
jgi:hypothetical protein